MQVTTVRRAQGGCLRAWSIKIGGRPRSELGRQRHRQGKANQRRRHRSAPRTEKKELADKPGSVVDNHSSGIRVATYLKRPTRKHMWATCAAQVLRPVPLASLFGLAPGGVCRAVECYHRRGALLPHPFTLTGPTCVGLRRFAFCCTFRGLTPPRRYLAPCPGSPDFPPRLRAAIAWPTPPRMVETRPATSKEKGCAGCNWLLAPQAYRHADA